MTGIASMLIGLVAAAASVPGASVLERAVRDRIAQSGADVAVAFQTLDGRDRLNIKTDEPFHAASTMKVPVMIELYRQFQQGRLKLGESVPVVNEFHSIVDASAFSLVLGDVDQALIAKGETTYRELCEAMITSSSNLAANILLERLKPANVQAAMKKMGASDMRVLRGVGDDKAFDKGLNNTTTAKALMTLLMALAKGQVVNREASEDMIAILARQQVVDGIPAGLPEGTRVAHKEGQITKINHDAGVVYGPRPFVLVVLVRGLDDQHVSASVIADITRIVYAATARK
jgi:beta-lactamase class A